jgi:hypothetical protein
MRAWATTRLTSLAASRLPDGIRPAAAVTITGARSRLSQTRKLEAETGSDLGISHLERVTGIEPALSAWELACHALLTTIFAGQGLFSLPVGDRYRPS